MADALLEFRETPNRADEVMYREIFDVVNIKNKHPTIFHNFVTQTATTKSEVRVNFTNTIESRTQVTITCAAGASDSEYLLITAGGTVYSLWIDAADDDTITGSTGADTDLSIQHDDTPTAATIATRGAALLNAQAEMVSWAVDDTIYVIGADKDNLITSAADVDTGFTVSSITSGISLDIVSSDAGDTQSAEIIYVDEDETETSETVTLTGTTEVNLTGTYRNVQGVRLSSAATGTITIHERGGTGLTFATVAASDICSMNARYYIPSDRIGICIIEAAQFEAVDDADPAGAADTNSGNLYVEKQSDLSIVARVKPFTMHRPARTTIEVNGADTTEEYVTAAVAETDTGDTAFTAAIEQTVITWDA